MPQPAANDRAAESLIRLYRDAVARLAARAAAIATDPRRTRERARLRDLIAAVDDELDALDAATRGWVRVRLPAVYADGARRTAADIGATFEWTRPHREAVQQAAARTWDELLTSTRFVRRDSKATIRRMARDATTRALLENVTPTRAAGDMAAALRETGIATVRYRNGARHSVADYADTVIRTETAQAYNQGALTLGREEGVEWWEYADGPGCCVGPGHSVGDLANGLVVRSDDIVPLAHPRCRRAIFARPDVTSPGQAVEATRAVEDREAAAAYATPDPTPIRFAAATTGRQPRTPRTDGGGRTPRRPRTPRR